MPMGRFIVYSFIIQFIVDYYSYENTKPIFNSLSFRFALFIRIFDYIRPNRMANGSNEATHSTALDKKRVDDEIARLRGENELLKAILIKHGINYVKERHMFRPNDYS